MMNIKFKKMQSTGNDFVVSNFAGLDQSVFKSGTIQTICDRNFGVGADGFIAVEKLNGPAFRFHYFNNDGQRSEMCANGCRAAILFAREAGWIKNDQQFDFVADDGMHKGFISAADQIHLDLKVKGEVEEIDPVAFTLPSWISKMFAIDTGVPHVVLICNSDIRNLQIHEIGKTIRFHAHFAPAGTNVNFVEKLTPTKIRVRTFERGIDAETLSCGTGITASALVARNLFEPDAASIYINSTGGDLKVQFEENTVLLSGPSKVVFKGNIEI